MDSDWFYDSNFHLNSAGAVYYTALVAQELKAEINDFTPIITQIPDKPEISEPNAEDGVLSEDLAEAAKIFKLSGVEITTENDKVAFNGTWIVNGLTDYGKTLSEIVIPDTLANIPITTISEGCFNDNDNVTKITLGKNISMIEGAVFDGCSKLTGIYITSYDPNQYHVASGILDNLSNCYFYVPEQVYTDYLFDYFWSFLNSSHPIKTY